MVIAPTARSPPYFWSEILNATVSRLSVDCMTKGDAPRLTAGSSSFVSMRSVLRRSRSTVVFPVRKRSTHAAETACERTVATAAPRTPMCRTKIKSGSSTTFNTAPMTTVFIATAEEPCAVMKPFRPSAVMTKTVPST